MEDKNAITEDISLLYPDAEKAERRMKYSNEASEALELEAYLGMKTASLSEFFSDDVEVLMYRQESIRDVIDVPEVLKVLKKCVPVMNDIADLRRLGAGLSEENDVYLYSITEAELYVSLMEIMREDLLPLKDRFKGRAMKSLCAKAEYLTASEKYKEINERLASLSGRVSEIKSITVGINLDNRLFPESAGVLSVNNEKFRMAQKLEKLLRLDFSKGDMDCIAPLIENAKSFNDSENEALKKAVNTSLGTVFRTSFRSWRKIVQTYVLENTDFLLRMLPEIEFLTKSADFLTSLREKGICFTWPVLQKDGSVCRLDSLINPVIALKSDAEMVPNDFAFDENAGIYVITGPNRGGKSVITCAVGLAFLMAQLGLPVCAEKAELSVCDNVFCHFPTGADDTVDKGRLGEECSRLYSIFSRITSKSLVLLDESLSSTGSYEASCIATEVLCGLSAAKCRAVFSTHLHSLAADIASVNERAAQYGGVKIDTLVAEISSGERSFKVRRASPDGRSYASDIAEKYGLSLDNIIATVKKKEDSES